MGNRTATHGARFQGDIQSAVFQAVVAQGLGRLAQSIDFGVGARVMVADGAVVPCPHHPALVHHHCAHRHFTHPLRRLGLRQSQAHGGFIAKRCLGWQHIEWFRVERQGHKPSLSIQWAKARSCSVPCA